MHEKILVAEDEKELRDILVGFLKGEGYEVDGRILELASPRVPKKEPTVYHIAQLRTILAACKPEVPTEDLSAPRKAQQ